MINTKTNFLSEPLPYLIMAAAIAPKDVVALVTSLASLFIGILSLLLAYRTFQSTRRHTQHEELHVLGRRHTLS
ncbi:hypothetical protein GGR51DRAFT_504643 [Nemania sp. FL0031]|nr:hypothetical protein GGR51DRAFT_504643 [Nemania sp. FL0031]